MVNGGPKIVTDGLLVSYDAGARRSYPGIGTTWYDSSGNDNHGTLANGASFVSEKGGGINFDGDNDRLTTNSFTYTPYCIDFWLYNNSVIPNNDSSIGGPSTYQTLINFGGTSVSGVNLGGWTSSATNEALHIWSSSGGSKLTYTRDESIAIGYHNWVFNWNGSSYDIWVDGEKLTTYAGTGGHAILQTYTNVPLYLGTNNVTYEFYGKIFLFKMYGTQKTDADILQNYNAVVERFD